MQIRLARFHELTPDELTAWSRYQQSDAALQSPYFRPEFSACVAAVRDDVEIAVLEYDGEVGGFFPFQRSQQHIARPVGGRLSDYHGVISAAGLPWDAEELLRGCNLRTWDFDHVPTSQTPFARFQRVTDLSPYLDLSAGFSAYRARLRSAGLTELRQTMRKGRKLAREVGSLRFETQLQDRDLLSTLIRWKSDQYQRTRVTDVFSHAWTVELLERILDQQEHEFAGVLSVLFAGGRPVAMHMGMRSHGNLHWWFPAYDPDYARYSPGRILLAELARAAPDLGIERIDLGRGVAPYKERAMSGAVQVAEGSVDLRPLARLLRQGWWNTRDWVRSSRLRGPARVPGRIIYRFREWIAFR